LFRTPAPDKDAYADIIINGHRETWRVRSKGFRGWLRHQFFQKTRAGCNSEAMQVAIETLCAFAQFDKDAEERQIHIRVAGHGGCIYIDLGDPAWQAVKVTKASWEVIASDFVPVRFRRTPSMRPLPMPTTGGSIEALRKLVNVRTDADFVLLVAYALAALRPDSNYPVLGVAGVQGSTKSSLIRLLQRLIDPRLPRQRSLPREEDDLIVAAKGAHFLGFDNVSRLSDEMSDAICRLSTGGASGKRQLYTDDEEVLFSGRRPVAFNGIEDVAARPDLVERTILLWLTRPKYRRREREIDATFELHAADIFGALLDGLVSGLANVDLISDDNLPRMADFAVWAEACCRVWWPADMFLKAYERNLGQAVEVVLEASPVATAVRALMARQATWAGTATQLLEVLTNLVGEKAAREKDWPKRAHVLSGRLRRITHDLAKVGIAIADSREAGTGTRIFTITTMGQESSERDPDYGGKTASQASQATNINGRNGLAVTLAGEDSVTATAVERHTPERDAACEAKISPSVIDKALKINECDGRDAPDAIFPTQSGKAEIPRAAAAGSPEQDHHDPEMDGPCRQCGGAPKGGPLGQLAWEGEVVPLHPECIDLWVACRDKESIGNGADPPVLDPYDRPRRKWATAAPDPDNPDHAVPLTALEGDVPPRMAPAGWWLELTWARELGQSPQTAPGLPCAVATGTH
jgi:hypothetical protein